MINISRPRMQVRSQRPENKTSHCITRSGCPKYPTGAKPDNRGCDQQDQCRPNHDGDLLGSLHGQEKRQRQHQGCNTAVNVARPMHGQAIRWHHLVLRLIKPRLTGNQIAHHRQAQNIVVSHAGETLLQPLPDRISFGDNDDRRSRHHQRESMLFHELGEGLVEHPVSTLSKGCSTAYHGN